jgi:CheY-like chemotaxis protein
MAKPEKTILVVEDSPAQALALELLLREEGLQVLWASDGRNGVAMAQQHMPDVIVLDVEMPHMDGFEACKYLKEDPETADIPIVMLTVRDDVTTGKRGIDSGAIDFIPKDAFSGPVLLETLRQLHILPEPGNIAQSARDRGCQPEDDYGED